MVTVTITNPYKNSLHPSQVDTDYPVFYDVEGRKLGIRNAGDILEILENTEPTIIVDKHNVRVVNQLLESYARDHGIEYRNG